MDELAARYGFTYEIAKADIDEKAIRHEDAQHLVGTGEPWAGTSLLQRLQHPEDVQDQYVLF